MTQIIIQQAQMRQVIEKAVAQFLLQSTKPVHEAPHRFGASFHGGAEGDEYEVEMDHISQELNHQLSSVVADSSVLSKVSHPPSVRHFAPPHCSPAVQADHRPSVSRFALLYQE